MGASKLLLVVGVIALLVAWSASSTGLLRQAPALLRSIVTVILIFAAVRVGLSIAVIAFDSSMLSLLIPTSFGLAAWWFRPRRNSIS
ncbi:MAG: hypothetical protein V3S00_01440 [Dehalococcoidia bacterium]